MSLTSKLIQKNLYNINKIAQVAGAARQYSSLPDQRIPEEKYISGKHGYAKGFGVPALKAKRAEKFAKRESSANKETTSKVSDKEIDHSKLSPIKQYKLEMARLREQYREESKLTEQKKKAESIKKVEEKEKLVAEKKSQLKEKVQEIQQRRQLDQLSSVNVLDGTPLSDVDPKNAFSSIRSFKFTPEYIEERDKMRKSNRFLQADAKQKAKMELLLELFYQSQSFITPDNFDEYVTNALRNVVPMVNSFTFNTSSNDGLVLALDKRQQHILDALDGTTHSGRPSFRQIQEHGDKV
jgi:HSP90 family molecular chaperone